VYPPGGQVKKYTIESTQTERTSGKAKTSTKSDPEFVHADFRMNLDLDKDVIYLVWPHRERISSGRPADVSAESFPKCSGVSHFAKCRENQPVTV